ncbi:hypothetical protein FB446DRAFT_767332 [Lentinula raphanica]|nr:hypothetical protein FB446DRAFT_767332 [Lentinula raphanica]
MIAQCHAKCWIIQLKEENSDYHSPTSQRGLRGNIIIYSQKVSGIAKLLPPSLDEIAAAICVIFEWLRTKAKLLAIRLHKDVVINVSLLDSLPDEHFLSVHVEHVMASSTLNALTSGYSPMSVPSGSPTDDHVDGSATSNQLRAAALRHVQNNGAFVQIPHAVQPVNEFVNPELFPLIYPTLFPYGIGGFEHHSRSVRVSFQCQVKHFSQLIFVHCI